MRYPFFLLICLTFTACDSPGPSPRPRAYPRVAWPEGGYQQFDQDFCAFSFAYPAYATVQQDTSFFDEKPVHPCWFDLYMPAFNGRLHFSYYPIGTNGKDLESLRKDAFNMVNWHNKRANYIDEIPFEDPSRQLEGMIFNIEGPAASPFQFFLTDGEDHFLRASLYLNTQVNTDSLAPVVAFIKSDLGEFFNTFAWQD